MSTTAGDVIASADVVPEDDAVIEGTGPDDTAYRLEIPAFALTTPTTIRLRPLIPVAIPGGRLVAGVEFEPDGTTFKIPVTLTMTPGSGTTKGLIPLQAAGDPATATASFGVVAARSATSISVELGHFSGEILATPGETQSSRLWSAAGTLPDGAPAADRLAWAQATMNALNWDRLTGGESDTFDSSMGAAWTTWLSASLELDGTTVKALKDRAKAGRLDDLIPFLDTIDPITKEALGAMRTDELMGAPSWAAEARTQDMLDIRRTFLLNVMDHIEKDVAFRKLLSGGLASDYDAIMKVVGVLLIEAKQSVLAGEDDLGFLVQTGLLDWLHRYGLKLAASCLQVPIVRDMATELGRKAGVFGDDELRAAMAKCVKAYDTALGSPQPSTDCGVGRAGWSDPLIDGVEVAAVDYCPPAPSDLPAVFVGEVSQVCKPIDPDRSCEMRVSGIRLERVLMVDHTAYYVVTAGMVTDHSESRGECHDEYEGSATLPADMGEDEFWSSSPADRILLRHAIVFIDAHNAAAPTYNGGASATVHYHETNSCIGSSTADSEIHWFLMHEPQTVTFESGVWVLKGTTAPDGDAPWQWRFTSLP